MTFEVNVALRGLSHGNPIMHPYIGETPKNRQPKDMPLDLHRRADNWFQVKFGIRYRSQALFITGSKFIAIAHAHANSEKHVVRIIPISAYSFCWSPVIKDLFSFGNSANGETIEEFLDSGKYSQTNLEEAIKSGNEIMLFCERYVAIPLQHLEKVSLTPTNYTGILLS